MRVADGVAIPLAEIELRTSRSSGPGGQHANVTDSRVEAVFDVAGSSALSGAQRRRIEASEGARVSAQAAASAPRRSDRRSACRRRRPSAQRPFARSAAYGERGLRNAQPPESERRYTLVRK